jgi:hypothetical protein
MSKEEVSLWSVDQVVTWLVANGLDDLDEKFISHHVDGKKLLTLTDQILLSEFKIRGATPRGVIMSFIEGTLNTTVLPVLICPAHNQLLNIFCKTDEVMICVGCLLSTHLKHDYCAPEDAIKERKCDLQTVVGRLVDHAKKKGERAMQVTDGIAALDRSYDGAMKGIEDEFRALHELVDAKKEEMVVELKRIRAESLKPLEEERACITHELGECTTLVDRIKKVTSSEATSAEVMVLLGDVKTLSDKATAVLDIKSSSNVDTNPEILLSFDESKLKTIKEAIKTVGSVREKGE